MKNWISGKNRLRSNSSDIFKFKNHLIGVIKSHLNIKIKDAVLLDVGCGDGAISFEIDKEVREVCCTDITSAYIELIEKKKLQFELLTNLYSKYKQDYFDCVYTFGVVQYLSKEEFDDLNLKLLNLLKQNGIIIHANVLDKKKIFNYYNKPNSIINIIKLFISGALKSILTNRIWNDGSRWHIISKLCRDVNCLYIVKNGFSDERSDIIIFK